MFLSYLNSCKIYLFKFTVLYCVILFWWIRKIQVKKSAYWIIPPYYASAKNSTCKTGHIGYFTLCIFPVICKQIISFSKQIPFTDKHFCRKINTFSANVKWKFIYCQSLIHVSIFKNSIFQFKNVIKIKLLLYINVSNYIKNDDKVGNFCELHPCRPSIPNTTLMMWRLRFFLIA